MVTFEVLGPVRIVRADGSVGSRRGLQGQLLATLLVHVNQVVSADRLIEAMWGPNLEAGTVHRLQTHVYRLRHLLDDSADITSEAGGYVLSANAANVDAQRFETLVQDAKEIGAQDPQRSVEYLRQALSLWRGDAFDGIDVPEVRSHALRLEDLKLVALEQLYAAELKSGQYDLVSNELPSILDAHPLRERLHELLVMSHALNGRQADALAGYRRARKVMVEELGVEPGARLRELEIQILKGEPVEPQSPAPKASAAPAQLPAGPGSFVGREDELIQLNGLLPEHQGRHIATVTGGGGMGKTAMALQWAHQHRANFPDGQLYMDLRGYGPDAPIEPRTVLLRFLRGLGVDPQQIPDDLEERSALFRSQTADRRILILLDNARGVEQVRPLLPGSPSCSVIITSREALTGIAVQDGAHQISLQRMTEDESTALVTQLLDVPQVPQGATNLAELCAYLPLALRIAVERVRAFGAEGLGELLADLKDESSTLDVLDGGDEGSSVRRVFLWSYQALDDAAGWLFRCFGNSLVRVISVPALAAAAGMDSRTARRGLASLLRAHLIEPVGNGRFHLHDLLRRFAMELSAYDESAQQRRGAFERLCDYYLNTTAAALEQIMPNELTFTAAGSILEDDSLPRPFSASDDAARWLETERGNLIQLVEQALPEGPHSFITATSQLLRKYLDLQVSHDGTQRVYSAALTAARCCGGPQEEGEALSMLGLLAIRRDRFDQSIDLLRAALKLHESAGERRHVANTMNLLGGAHMLIRRMPGAFEYYEKAIAEYRALGDPGASVAMSNFGLLLHRIGDLEGALSWLKNSLRISEDHGQRHSECAALRNLVGVHQELGNYDLALDCANRGLNLAQDLGRDPVVAAIHVGVGAVYQQLKDLEEAREHHLQALSIAHALDDVPTVADAHIGLAETARASGDFDEALHHHQTALGLSPDLWHVHSHALISLGATYLKLEDTESAVEHWREALAIYEEVGHADVAQLRDEIDRHSSLHDAAASSRP